MTSPFLTQIQAIFHKTFRLEMLNVAVFAVPTALLWILLTNRVGVDSFLIGLGIGVGVLWANDFYPHELNWRRVPDQLLALGVYMVGLARDIVLSSIDVAHRVLSPNLPCAPGIIALTLDKEDGQIAGLSAHAISITPGELVVDFEGEKRLFVHVLDIHASTDEKLARDQHHRERLLKRVLGRD